MSNNSIFFIVALFVLAGCRNADSDKSNALMQTGKDYPVYGGNKAGNRYSPLKQINTDNVKKLQLAWTYYANNKPDTTGKKPARPREFNASQLW